MYDDLLEKDEFVQRQKELGRELGWEEGREEGKQEGAMQASQKILVDYIKVRYPSLVELAQHKAEEIDNAPVLQEVIKIIFSASNEEAARAILDAA